MNIITPEGHAEIRGEGDQRSYHYVVKKDLTPDHRDDIVADPQEKDPSQG